MLRSVTAVTLLSTALGSVRAPQDKIKLEIARAKDQKSVVTIDTSAPAILVRTQSRAETKEEKITVLVKEKYTDQSLDDTRSRITCESSSRFTNAREDRSPFLGQTVILDTIGGGRAVTREDGTPVQDPAADHLGRWNDVRALLPPQEVGSGETWTVDGTGLIRGFHLNFQASKLEVKCTLQSIADGNAVIAFEGAIDEVKEKASLKATFQGTLSIDTAQKRPLKLDLTLQFQQSETLLEIGRDPRNLQDAQNKIGTIAVSCERSATSVTFEYPQ